MLAPSLSDLLFIALILWLLIFTNSGSPTGLLQDAGAGVHIRTGEWILSHHSVPRTDPFSFSKPGEAWYAWEWLSDVLFTGLNTVWGLKGLILFTAIVLAGVCWLLVRHMAVRGANALAAILMMNVVIGAASVHFLARPHIFTLILLSLAFFLIDQDRTRESLHLWFLVPLTALWANLHGGFTGLFLTLGALTVGTLLEGRKRAALRYAGVGAACLLASFLNPYGYHLHLHVIEFLRSDWIRRIVLEFQPPRLDTASGVYFEVLLFLGLALCGRLAYQKRFGEALAILAWAHASMVSVRHVPIFALLAGPYLAQEITILMRRAQHSMTHPSGMGPKSIWAILNQLGDEHQPGLLRTSLMVPLFLAALFAFDCGFTYPTDFPSLIYPTDAMDRYDGLIRTSRLYTTDAWGDYLIYRNYPQQRVFFDGRTDYYGEALTLDYETLLNGFPGWEDVMKKHRIDAVLLPPASALAGLLRGRAGWEELETTDRFTVLRAVGKGGQAALSTAVPDRGASH